MSFRPPAAGRESSNIRPCAHRGFAVVDVAPILDYYLVLAGPSSAALSSRGGLRPWCIAAVYLFDAKRLLDEQRQRGVKIGVA
ncbi:MAG: hypothetical protein ACRDSL_07840 [Pseudonocardiaceae bacterium]